MKKYKLTLIALIISLFSFVFVGSNDEIAYNLKSESCIPNLSCRLSSEDIMIEGGRILNKYYIYNKSGVLERIDYSYDNESEIVGYDSFIYNKSEQLIKVISNPPGIGDEQEYIDYTYLNGKISKIELQGTFWFNGEKNDYSSTAEITYNGDNIEAINIYGDIENMAFRNFEYTEGNISSYEVDFTGEREKWITLEVVEYDSCNNINQYMILDWSSIMLGTNANNRKVVVVAEAAEIDGLLVNAGDTLLHHSYTYDSENMVRTLTHNKTVFEEGGRVTTIEWEYLL